jgi:hypothetical protein
MSACSPIARETGFGRLQRDRGYFGVTLTKTRAAKSAQRISENR